MNKPVVGPVPEAAPRPKPQSAPAKRQWAFSLRYWKQIDNFQVGQAANRWFVSLLERLAELSRLKVEDVLNQFDVQDALRFHNIDWAAKNIPIDRTTIDWVPKVYWDNEDEFPLVQFHISKALGRVAGFFDENLVFNVVLLDPNHNLQPSAYNGYKVRYTQLGDCELATLQAGIGSLAAQQDLSMENLQDELRNLLIKSVKSEQIYIVQIAIEERHFRDLNSLVELCAPTCAGSFIEQLIHNALK